MIMSSRSQVIIMKVNVKVLEVAYIMENVILIVKNIF